MLTPKHLILLVWILLMSISSKAQNVTYKWINGMGGISNDKGQAITTDKNFNVFTLGVFESIADFDPSAGTYTLASNGSSDIFITKFDSSGNFNWAKSFGGTDGDFPSAIATDINGNIYSVGVFYSDTVDFDPGPATYTLTHSGNNAFFITKYSNAGDFIWAKEVSPTAGYINALSIAIDNDANIYTTGYTQGSTDFDPNAGSFVLVGSPNDYTFILKLDSLGDFKWAKMMYGTGTNSNYGTSIAVDANKNVYTAGPLSNSVADFDPGPGTFNITAYNSSDIFISKLDSLGNFVWAKAIGTNIDADQAVAIAVNDSGDIYLTGSFTDVLDFDPGPNTYTVQAPGYDDAFFIEKLNSSGNFIWVDVIGETHGNCNTFAIALDKKSNIYVTGIFQNTVNFGNYSLTSSTSNGNFICKIDSSSTVLWAMSLQGIGYEYDYSICTDTLNNIYIAGFYGGSIYGNPYVDSSGIVTHGSNDVFVLKLGQDNSSSSGILQYKNDKLMQLFPNPNSGSFMVKTNTTEKQTLQIFDMNGKLVLNEVIDNEKHIQANNLSAGIYDVSLISNNSITHKKLVIVK